MSTWITLKNGVHLDLDSLSDDDKVKFFGSKEAGDKVVADHKANNAMNNAIRNGANNSNHSRTLGTSNNTANSKVADEVSKWSPEHKAQMKGRLMSDIKSFALGNQGENQLWAKSVTEQREYVKALGNERDLIIFDTAVESAKAVDTLRSLRIQVPFNDEMRQDIEFEIVDMAHPKNGKMDLNRAEKALDALNTIGYYFRAIGDVFRPSRNK